MLSVRCFWEFQGVSYTTATCGCPLSPFHPSRAVCAGGGSAAHRGAQGLLRGGGARGCRPAGAMGGCASAGGAELLFPPSFPCTGVAQRRSPRDVPRPGSGP